MFGHFTTLCMKGLMQSTDLDRSVSSTPTNLLYLGPLFISQPSQVNHVVHFELGENRIDI